MKVLVFLVEKTVKDIKNHSLKAANMFLPDLISFKTDTTLYSNASQYSGTTNACKNMVSPKLTDCLIHHLNKLEGIHEICRNF